MSASAESYGFEAISASHVARSVVLPLLAPLSAPEQATLDGLEAAIERGLATFVEVGNALQLVRDGRLYRASFGTFEDYCRERWGMSKTQANRLVASAAVVGTLAPMGVSPAAERQIRPLTRLEPEQQRAAWQEAVETAPRDNAGAPRITAAHVENVVREVEGRPALAVHFTSDSPEWYTPQHIVAAVVQVLGAIDLDPCANVGTSTVLAATRYTASDNGLAHEWAGRVYMNPPYGRGIDAWTRKLRTSYESGVVSAAVALVPARTDTAWMADLRAYPRCFLRGRLSFSEHENAAPFPSCAIYFGTDLAAFHAAFAALGDTYVLYG